MPRKYWLAGWCTYELLRLLERVHQSLKPQRSVLYLMSFVKNAKSKLVIQNQSDDVDENEEENESLLLQKTSVGIA